MAFFWGAPAVQGIRRGGMVYAAPSLCHAAHSRTAKACLPGALPP